MVRGGRSHGSRSNFSSRSNFGRSNFGHHHHHHHYGGGRRGVSNSGAQFGAAIDLIANMNTPPTLLNGVYTLSGNQMNVTNRLNDPIPVASVPMMGQPNNLMGQLNNSLVPMQGMPMQGI